MRLLLIISLFTVSILSAQKVLVLNSNSSIAKYTSVENSFKDSFENEVRSLDISKMTNKQIKEYLYDEYPDIVYAIGTKAYKYANIYLPEKTIFFSSIVNYKRLDLQNNRYGVSNELHSGMNLTIIKYLFADIKKLNIIYSSYTQDLFESFKTSASKMGMTIIGQNITQNSDIDMKMIQNSDGLILIADPILLKDEKKVLSIFKETKNINKPIFAYNELYIKFDATLVISADNPTIGRQISSMIEQYQEKKDFIPVQLPMGTNIIFNKKIADKLNLKYNKNNLSAVNRVID